MENASKALIIAGAILLAIAIIGIGMYVFNMASNTVNQANMSGQEKTAYNSEFTSYEGNQTGTTVKALIDTIRTHNLTNKDDLSKQIVYSLGAKDSTASNCTNHAGDTAQGTTITTANKTAITAGTTYVVSFGYSTTGLIKNINVAPLN